MLHLFFWVGNAWDNKNRLILHAMDQPDIGGKIRCAPTVLFFSQIKLEKAVLHLK